MIERSEERDSAIRAALPHVPRLGWSRAALSAGLRALGRDPVEQEWLFPRGPAGAVEAWIDLADREMEAAARAEDLLSLRIPARIRRVVLIRLEQQEPQKEAVRLGLSHLALPWNAGAAVRSVARTADSMWVAAGGHLGRCLLVHPPRDARRGLWRDARLLAAGPGAGLPGDARLPRPPARRPRAVPTPAAALTTRAERPRTRRRAARAAR
jgi:hypothetical protein